MFKRPGTHEPDSSGADGPGAPTPPESARLTSRADAPKSKTVSRKAAMAVVIVGGGLFATAAWFSFAPKAEPDPLAQSAEDAEGRRNAYAAAMPDALTQADTGYSSEDFAPPVIETPPEPAPDPVAANDAPAVDMSAQYVPPPQPAAPAAPAGPTPEEQAMMQEAEAARTSAILYDGARTYDASASGAQSPQEAAAIQQAQGGQPMQPTNAAMSGGGSQPVTQRAAFMDGPRNELYLTQPIVEPVGRYEVKSPTMIPLVLTTAINSDLPGPVSARITSNIYDSATGKYLLIPRGSIVEGQYDSDISYGESRILIRWDELTLPNGDSILLEGMPATDPQGRAGLDADVNRHLFRLGVATVISGGFSVLGQLATDDSEEGSIGDDVGDAVAQEAARVGGRVVDRELQVQPTLTAELGTRLHLVVNRDILLRPFRESQ